MLVKQHSLSSLCFHTVYHYGNINIYFIYCPFILIILKLLVSIYKATMGSLLNWTLQLDFNKCSFFSIMSFFSICLLFSDFSISPHFCFSCISEAGHEDTAGTQLCGWQIVSHQKPKLLISLRAYVRVSSVVGNLFCLAFLVGEDSYSSWR